MKKILGFVMGCLLVSCLMTGQASAYIAGGVYVGPYYGGPYYAPRYYYPYYGPRYYYGPPRYYYPAYYGPRFYPGVWVAPRFNFYFR